MGTSGLGTLLVEEGLLTEADRRTIRRTCGTHGSAFARAVLALGLLDEDELAAFLAERTRWKMCAKDLARESSREAWGTLDPPLVERLEVMPLRVEGQVLHVAMVDPLDHDTIKQVEFFTGYRVTPHIATFTQVRLGLEKLIKNYRPQTSHLEELIINHASSANRRLRLLDRAGGSTAPRAVSRAPAFDAGAATALREEEDFAGPIEEVEDVDADAALEYPDSVEAAEESQKLGFSAPDGDGDPLAISEDLDADDLFGELTQTDGEDAGPTVDTLDAAEDSGLTGLSGAVTQPDPAGMSDMDDIEGAAGVTAGGADDELLGLEGLDELEGPDGLGDLDDPFAAPKAQAKKKTTAPFEDLGASPDAEGDLASGDDLDLSEGFGAISPAAEADGDDDLATIDFSDGVEDTGDELGFETEPPPPAKAAAKPAPVAARAPDPLADLGLDDQLDFGPEDASASDPLADLDLEGGGDPLADLGMSDADADPLAGLGLDDDAAPVATAKTAESDEKDGDDLLDDDSIGDELDISEAPTKDPDSAGAFLDEDDLLGELDVAESAAPPEPDLFDALDEAENAAKPAARTPSALDDADLLAELDLAEDAAPAEPDLLDELEMTEDGPRAPAADLAMDDDGLPPAPDGFLDEPLGELSMEADAPLDLPPPAAEKDPLGAFDLEGELALEDGGNSLPAPATDENEDALELDGEFPGFDDLSPDEEADLLATPQPAPRRAAGVALEPEPDELQSEAEDFTTAAAARVAALNRALVGLTMAKDLSSALRRAAPALAAAGLTKALILVQDGKQAKPICVWKADGATPPLLEEQNLYGYVTQGLVAGLSRYADGWQAAYDAARAVDFKPLAAWQSPGARLMAGAFDGKNAKRLIVFGAWPEATDAATLDAAIAVLRRVAAHA